MTDVDYSTLVIDDRIEPPKALNRHLASVSLQIISNQYEDGYDLAVSAHVNGEWVTLEIGDAQLEVFLEIKKFEIDMSFCRSAVSFGPDYVELSREAELRYQVQSKQSVSENRTGTAGLNLSKSPEASIGGQMSAEKSGVTEFTSNERQLRRYQHIDIKCISASEVGSSAALYGPIVSSYVGWNVRPKSNSLTSGALARLRVTRPWITIRKPKLTSTVGHISDRIAALFRSGDADDEFKRLAFAKLLEKLIHLQLQEPHEEQYATLAASCVVLRPDEEGETLITDQRSEPIRLDLRTVEQFLDTKDPIELERLIEAPASSLDDDPIALETPEEPEQIDGAKIESTHGDIFTFPRFYPVDLVPVLHTIISRFLIEDVAISTDVFERIQYIQDLESLGLISVKQGEIVGVDANANDDAGMLLRNAVLDVSAIKHAFDAYKTGQYDAMIDERPLTPKEQLDYVFDYDEDIPKNVLVAVVDKYCSIQHRIVDEDELEHFIHAWCEFCATVTPS